jgi:hypothetical protein
MIKIVDVARDIAAGDIATVMARSRPNKLPPMTLECFRDLLLAHRGHWTVDPNSLFKETGRIWPASGRIVRAKRAADLAA